MAKRAAALTTRAVGAIVTGSILALTRLLGMFSGSSWDNWRTILKAIVGAPLTDSELAFFQRVTRRTAVRPGGFQEVWLLVGRRGGKSIITALLAVFQCCCKTYTLAPGEIGVFVVISATRYQARVIYTYIVAMLRILGQYDEQPITDGEPTATEIVLRNGLHIEIHAASYRNLRGYTVIGAACDEVAFWQSDDSANPDVEILNALRPAMATVPNALLCCITSVYARRGEVWRMYQKHFGNADSDVLVVQAPTQTMNPAVRQSVIDKAYEDDPSAAAAEYGSEFRTDIEAFVTHEAVAACVAAGCYELAPARGLHYRAFVDPAGGSGGDSMTLAIAHVARGRIVIDALREAQPPFSPDDVVKELADLLKSYRVTQVTGDRWGGEWPRERLQKHGISYRVGEKTKSELYQALLPRLNAGTIDLLDHERCRKQALALERRTTRGGKDSIDHPSGGHDDVINAVAGVAYLLRDGQAAVATIQTDEHELAERQARAFTEAAQLGAMLYRMRH